MSSSPRRAPNTVTPSSTAPARRAEPPQVSMFVYGEVAPHRGSGQAPAEAERRGASEPSLAARIAEREAQARQLGRQQGEAEARSKFEEQLSRERGGMAQAVTDFARERAAYYRKLEEEAVRLALSIARKVIHREAQTDPQLLMSVVRVALEKIEGATLVRLAVNPKQAADWRRYFAARPELAASPEVVEDAAMPIDQCGLRTAMGATELGLERQLKEIEQGLMDLLAARPQDRK